MIEQLSTYPGLKKTDAYFERAYSTGSGAFPTARVRFMPRHLESAIARDVKGSAAPMAVSLAVSISLVDTEGQVIDVGGHLLVNDASSHSWQASGGDALDAEAWLLWIVENDLPQVISWAAMISSAASIGLLMSPVKSHSTIPQLLI